MLILTNPIQGKNLRVIGIDESFEDKENNADEKIIDLYLLSDTGEDDEDVFFVEDLDCPGNNIISISFGFNDKNLSANVPENLNVFERRWIFSLIDRLFFNQIAVKYSTKKRSTNAIESDNEYYFGNINYVPNAYELTKKILNQLSIPLKTRKEYDDDLVYYKELKQNPDEFKDKEKAKTYKLSKKSDLIKNVEML